MMSTADPQRRNEAVDSGTEIIVVASRHSQELGWFSLAFLDTETDSLCFDRNGLSFFIYQQTYTDNVTGRLGFVMQMIRVRAKINSQFQQSTNYNNKKLHVHLLTLLTQLSDLWFLIYTFNFNFEHRLRFSETHNETTITPIKSQQNVFFSMWIRHFRPCQVFLKAQLFKLLIWMAE